MVHHHARRLYVGTTAERTTLASSLGIDSIGICFWDTDTTNGYLWSGTAWVLESVPTSNVEGQAVISNATPAWVADTTPTWKGLHTFDGGLLIGAGQVADLNGVADALVLDADGDTTISSPTGNQIDFEIAGADDFTMTANLFNVLTGSGIAMADATWIGISGNEILTVSATGNWTFGGVTSIVVPDGAWVGADAACAWVFDSSNSDVTTLDKAGIGIAAPTGQCHVVRTGSGSVIIAESDTNNQVQFALASTHNSVNNASVQFFLQNDTPTSVLYAGMSADNITRTAAAETGTLKFTTRVAGVWGSRLNVRLNVWPSAAKSQDLGISTHEWDDIFYVTANVGTSRLVDSTRMCPVCGERMKRGTGTVNILAEGCDYALVFCVKCGCAAMEEWRHLPSEILTKRRLAPKIILEGVRVKTHGRSRQVAIDFRYGDDVVDEDGMVVEPAIKNSTRLGELEIEAFSKMDVKKRREFLLMLGQREWESREENRLMKEVGWNMQVNLDVKIADWIGTDLLLEAN